MKKIASLILILSLLLTFALTGCSNEISDYSIIDNNTVKIGVLVPSSGEFSNIGQDVISGVEYANSLASTVNIKENCSIELIIKDLSQGIPDAATDLIEEKAAAVICYASNESNTEEIIKAFEESSVPLLFIDVINSTIQSTDKLFSLAISSEYQISALSTYISGKGYTKGSVVCTTNNSYSKSFAELFASSLKSINCEVTNYNYGTEEASYNAGTVIASNNEFVFIVGNLADSLNIHTDLIQSRFTGEIILSEMYDKTLLEKEEYNELTFISKFEPDDINYIGTDFINVYSDAYDISSDKITSSITYGYDAYMLIYDALSSFNPSLQNSILSSNSSTAEASEAVDVILASDLTKAISATQHMGATDTIVFNEKGTVLCNFLYINTIENSNSTMLDRYDFKNN